MSERRPMDLDRERLFRLYEPPEPPFRWTSERCEAMRQLEIADLWRKIRGWRKTHIRIGPRS